MRRGATLAVTLAALATPLLLVGSEERGIALFMDAGALRMAPFDARPFALPASFTEVPPVASWLDGYADDPWLVSWVRERLARGRPWDHAVAAGLVQRLHHPSAGEARRRVEALIRGDDAEPHEPPAEWARQLAREQAVALDREAAEEALILGEALAEALAHLDPDDGSWCELMSTLLVRRDDLEGVRELLAAAGQASRIAATLAAMDDEWANDSRSWPVFAVANERRLARAGAATADAWWVAPWHLWREERGEP